MTVEADGSPQRAESRPAGWRPRHRLGWPAILALCLTSLLLLLASALLLRRRHRRLLGSFLSRILPASMTSRFHTQVLQTPPLVQPFNYHTSEECDDCVTAFTSGVIFDSLLCLTCAFLLMTCTVNGKLVQKGLYVHHEMAIPAPR